MLLRIENITLNIGGLHILRGVTAAIEEGQITSIIGPNGAGKTTLFNVITGRMAPTRGKVWFKEKDITNVPPYEIARSGIARSFQITNIFKEMTVFDNVCHRGPDQISSSDQHLLPGLQGPLHIARG